jgi:hypothetical protein
MISRHPFRRSSRGVTIIKDRVEVLVYRSSTLLRPRRTRVSPFLVFLDTRKVEAGPHRAGASWPGVGGAKTTLPGQDIGNGIKADANGTRPRARAGDVLGRVARTPEGSTDSSATARAAFSLKKKALMAALAAPAMTCENEAASPGSAGRGADMEQPSIWGALVRALPTQRHDLPCSRVLALPPVLTQGSSVVERRLHRAKVAGSIPAPAPISREPGCCCAQQRSSTLRRAVAGRGTGSLDTSLRLQPSSTASGFEN